jgi:pyruvate/2-oxoglutarate/acetoin dehydrogenase E1 component
VGIAIGAAAAGLRPVAFITYMDFLTLGFDALVNYGAKLRYKTAGQLKAPCVVKATAGAKGQGVAHSQSLEPWLMNVPGLKIAVPSNAWDAYGLLKTAIRDEGPVVYVDHKRLFPTAGEVPDGEELVPFGEAAIRRAGDHLTIVSYGYMIAAALKAAELLAKDGVSAEVLDLRTLAPLDITSVCTSVARTRAALLLEEGQLTCGIGAELAFAIREQTDGVRIARIGARRAPISSNPVFEAYCVPDAARVCEAALVLLDKKRAS